MALSSLFFLLRRPKHLNAALTTSRFMGGGPRTFPGGLNKWQYKRIHEKLAKEKERKLLNQEKQLYEARLRSEIRAKRAASNQESNSSDSPNSSSNYTGMSSKEHIKALADRFMKGGAEDLWNEDDGPIRLARRVNFEVKPLDLRKIVKDGRSSVGKLGSLEQRREYSKMRRNLSSDDEHDGLDGDHGGLIGLETRPMNLKKFANDGRRLVGKLGSIEPRKECLKWRRNSSSDEEDVDFSGDWGGGGLIRKELKISRFGNKIDDGEEEETGFGGRRRKMMMSGAALMKFDRKKERRVLRGVDEEEGNLLEQIRGMHEEIRSRESIGCRAEAKEESMLTQKRFDECSISPLTIKALDSAGYVQMTVVQEAALPVCLEGKDVLVKARTGTGKSAAFLLPAIETVLKATGSNSNHRVPPILVLIICPTRELAIQLAAEANVLVRHHDGIGIQTLIGGTRFKLDQKRLESNPCQIIVATPGRLLDHIENKSGFSVRLMGLKLLILDEADHLLDLGFRKDIEKIVDCIPRQRQSLLFSATIPKEVRRISQVVLKKEHVFVDTVGLGNVETPAKVMQSFIVAPHELHFHLLHHLLKEHIMQELDYKVIVFCTTAMGAAFMYVLLRGLKMNVREMHSRKPQLYRARMSDEFRESKRLILVTSDISSRGVHYPDVTLVIQVGIPSDREQYIHRLGRTGREGKEGRGILLLAPWEEYFMQEMEDLPIEQQPIPDLDSEVKQKLGKNNANNVTSTLPDPELVEESIRNVDTSIKEAAYHAWLGYYNSIGDIGRDKTLLADLATRFCGSIGLEKPPPLYRKTAIKMGLKDVPGIRIRK